MAMNVKTVQDTQLDFPHEGYDPFDNDNDDTEAIKNVARTEIQATLTLAIHEPPVSSLIRELPPYIKSLEILSDAGIQTPPEESQASANDLETFPFICLRLFLLTVIVSCSMAILGGFVKVLENNKYTNWIIAMMLLSIWHIVQLTLMYEGIQKSNLRKMEQAILNMKIFTPFLWVYLIVFVVKDLNISNCLNNSCHAYILPQNVLLSALCITVFYTFYFIALKVRSILKDC